MTEQEEYDKAFADMSAEPLELDETQPIDRRKFNRGTIGNKGGRPPKSRTLVINGVIQDGHWRVVSVTEETIVIESTTKQ